MYAVGNINDLVHQMKGLHYSVNSICALVNLPPATSALRLNHWTDTVMTYITPQPTTQPHATHTTTLIRNFKVKKAFKNKIKYLFV